MLQKIVALRIYHTQWKNDILIQVNYFIVELTLSATVCFEHVALKLYHVAHILSIVSFLVTH